MTANPPEPVRALEDVQQKTQAVQADIERAADEAGVIGTVLAQEVPVAAQVGDVATAIQQTTELEKKLTESAEALAKVTAELERLKDEAGGTAPGAAQG